MSVGTQDYPTSAINHVMQLCEANDGTISHDVSDPLQAEYLQWLLDSSGKTEERYPALHRLMKSPVKPALLDSGVGANTGAFIDGQQVDFVSSRNNGLTGARATFTRNKPISYVYLTLQVINVTSGVTTVLASGTSTTFSFQTVNVDTNDSTALAYMTTGVNSGLLTWSVQYQDGTFESNSMSASFWAFNTTADPTVTAPIINPNRHTGDLNDIVIGLSRGYNSPANNTDVDYWFWQNQYANTTLLVPVTGSMYFSYNIAPLNANNPIPMIYLTRAEGGTSGLAPAQLAMSSFTIDPNNPKKLNFSFVATATAAGTALNFGASPWVADTKTYLTFRITVAFQGGSPQTNGWSSILSADNPDQDPTDGVAYINPIVFVWHCLVAGTQVTMSDGSTKNIEDVQVGDVVQSGNGTTMPVQANLAQPHFGTAYTVTLASGKTISCSGTHPVITPGGPVSAASLTSGTQVLTSAGTDTVSSVTTFTQNGEGLFNLWLNGTVGQTYFYAGSILVGDYQIQVALVNEEQTNPKMIRAKLPPELLTDFDSHVEDMAVCQK